MRKLTLSGGLPATIFLRYFLISAAAGTLSGGVTKNSAALPGAYIGVTDSRGDFQEVQTESGLGRARPHNQMQANWLGRVWCACAQVSLMQLRLADPA